MLLTKRDFNLFRKTRNVCGMLVVNYTLFYSEKFCLNGFYFLDYKICY